MDISNYDSKADLFKKNLEIKMYFRSLYTHGKRDFTLVSLEDAIHAGEHNDLTLEDIIPVSDITTRTTEEAIIAKETINKLWDRLDNTSRYILYLIFVCDMKQVEVANILGTYQPWVSRKVSNIRKLAKYYYMEGTQ